jgi:phosphoribosyl 1,2-cyclic phosphodiesterase
MEIHLLASGSTGNSTLIKYRNTNLIIDLGLAKSTLVKKLKMLDTEIEDINGILITHEHIDHVRAIDKVDETIIYAEEVLLKKFKLKGNQFNDKESFRIEDFVITPFLLSHDANCHGFIIETIDKSSKLVYLADTGYLAKGLYPLLKNADYYVIESNHDVPMLLNLNRPIYLTKRILSNKGHLSNEDAAYAIVNLIGDKTKEIALAHLSLEANTKEKAIQATILCAKEHHISLDKCKIKVADAYETVSIGEVAQLV